MNTIQLALLILLAAGAAASCPPPPSQVQLPNATASGYVPIDDKGSQLFFLFYEAQSRAPDDPKRAASRRAHAPITLWLQVRARWAAMGAARPPVRSQVTPELPPLAAAARRRLAATLPAPAGGSRLRVPVWRLLRAGARPGGRGAGPAAQPRWVLALPPACGPPWRDRVAPRASSQACRPATFTAGAWNRKSALLFIDQPVGAGFSLPGERSGCFKQAFCSPLRACLSCVFLCRPLLTPPPALPCPGKERSIPKDEMTLAADLYCGLQAFFQRYPDLQAHPLVIAGESYAGGCGPEPAML